MSRFFFEPILTESCALKYCQDGLEVYYSTETQHYTYLQIYGHYELQPNDINGKLFFLNEKDVGLWWDGVSFWWIGSENSKGEAVGVGYIMTDVFCPYQLPEWDWTLWDGSVWFPAGNQLGINCNNFFIPKKYSLNFI